MIHFFEARHSALMCDRVVRPAQADFPVSRIIHPLPVISHTDCINMVDFAIFPTYRAFSVLDARVQVLPDIIRARMMSGSTCTRASSTENARYVGKMAKSTMLIQSVWEMTGSGWMIRDTGKSACAGRTTRSHINAECRASKKCITYTELL